MKNFKNNATVNPTENPASKKWCFNAKLLKSAKQINAKVNGRKYSYLSFYPAKAGDIAIIGDIFPPPHESRDSGASTGTMVKIEETVKQITVNKNYALAMELVFSENITKSKLDACNEYIQYDSSDYESTLQFGRYCATIDPITYFIAKILASSSILAFPDKVTAESLEKAKACIFESKSIDSEMLDLYWGPPENIGLNLSNVYVDIDTKHLCELENISVNGKKISEIKDYDEGFFDCWCYDLDYFVDSPEIEKYITKYSFIGAVSIMVRGGFKNLLEAFLSVKPPIAEFYEEMLDDIGEHGDPETLEVIRNYSI